MEIFHYTGACGGQTVLKVVFIILHEDGFQSLVYLLAMLQLGFVTLF
jgi:hypothetical protein